MTILETARQWLDWYTTLPRWQRYVPLAVIALLWLALVLS